eukprot:c25297_g23_i1 orf=33-530(+)
MLDFKPSSMEKMLCVEDVARLLRMYGKTRDCTNALRLHAHMRQSGPDAWKSLGNDHVLMLISVGCICDAHQVFDTLAFRNEKAWIGLISAYMQCGKTHDALSLYQQMQTDDSVHPDGRTFVTIIKACAKLKDLDCGRKVHSHVAKLGLLKGNKFVASTLVDMYAK